jgi:hypothetical protein
MRSSADEAVKAARSYSSYAVGYCLRWVVTVWQAPSIGCPDAITSWEWATMKHPGDRHPPAGAPVYYKGGKHGHIAVSMGSGRIRSTDCKAAGVVSEADLNWPEKAWGYPYLGWTGDLSKVALPLTSAVPAPKPPPPPPPLPEDDMTALIIGADGDPTRYTAPLSLATRTPITKAVYENLTDGKHAVPKGTYIGVVMLDLQTLNGIPLAGDV